MPKAAILTIAAIALFLALGGAIVWGAQSLPVPVSYPEQQNCAARAKTEYNAHPNCPKTETLWDRGLRDPVAFYTLWLTLFTLALAVGSAFQSGLIWRQIALARDEFNATHRPQIVIHSVKFEAVVSPSGDFDLNKAAATVIFYNTGASPAVIEGIKFSIAQRRLPLESGITLHHEVAPKHTTIESGMGDYIELGSDIPRFASDSTSRVILIGKIFYRDRAGGLRQTGFCRMLVPQSSTWERLSVVSDAEYEYGY